MRSELAAHADDDNDEQARWEAAARPTSAEDTSSSASAAPAYNYKVGRAKEMSVSTTAVPAHGYEHGNRDGNGRAAARHSELDAGPGAWEGSARERESSATTADSTYEEHSRESGRSAIRQSTQSFVGLDVDIPDLVSPLWEE